MYTSCIATYNVIVITWTRPDIKTKILNLESLANLVNRLQFAKLKPSKVVVTIKNPLDDPFIRQTFPTKHLKRVNLPNVLPAKLCRYTVHLIVTTCMQY